MADSRNQMVIKHKKRFIIESFAIGDLVSAVVPRMDRTGTDDRRIFAKVIKKPKKNRYQIVTKYGIIKNLLPTNGLIRLQVSKATSDSFTWDESKTITLHAAADANSTSDKVGLSCSCRTECRTRRCVCFKNEKPCSVYCHKVEDFECGNLSSLAERTESQIIRRSQRQKKVKQSTSTVKGGRITKKKKK